MPTTFAENTTIDKNGNIPFSQKIRDVLRSNGLGAGAAVTIFFDGEQLRVMDSAKYALLEFQRGMAGKAEEAGFHSEEDVYEYVKQIRSGR